MRKLFMSLLLTSVVAFANEACDEMRAQFRSVIADQSVVQCRVNGVEKGRTDIMGMFFTMKSSTETEDAVLLYGSNYDTMLYLMKDPFVKNVECIQNSQFRAIKRNMTSEQIINKLMDFKNCY